MLTKESQCSGTVTLDGTEMSWTSELTLRGGVDNNSKRT